MLSGYTIGDAIQIRLYSNSNEYECNVNYNINLGTSLYYGEKPELTVGNIDVYCT